MNHSMKNPIIFLLMIPLLVSFHTFAQNEPKIPADFFVGKWGGTISGEVVDKQPNRPIRKYPFSIELVGYPAKLEIGPFGGGTMAWMKIDATWPGNFTVIYDTVLCGVYPQVDPPFFNILYPVGEPPTTTEFGYNTIFYLAGFSVQMENNNLIHLTSGGADTDLWEDSWGTGKLHRIYVKKDTLGKTVQINEPIKTDEFTQREILVPNKGKVIVNTNSDGVFTSESELDIIFGEIYSKIKPGGDYKVRSPIAVDAVRGTQFITKVEKDGATTLTVLDGEVEFSDIKKKDTVIVKKNQRSVVKPGGLPTEPKAIEQNQIPRWWE